MHRPLALYIVILVAMSLAAWQPSLSWMAPVSSLALLSGVVWMWRAEGRSLCHLGLHGVTSWWHKLGWGMLIGLFLPLATAALQAINGWIGLSRAPRSMKSLTVILLLAVFKTAFVAAYEELVFRGYYLQRFRVDQGTVRAALFSSLLWAGMHLPSMVTAGLSPPLLAIGTCTFVLWGMTLSAAFLRSGNALWFPYDLHYGYNLCYSLLGAFVATTYHAPSWLTGQPAWAPESGLLGLIVWLIAFALYSVRPSRNSQSQASSPDGA